MATTKENPTSLNEAQLQLLKLFDRKMPEKELAELKQALVKFYNDKAQDEIDKVWEEKGYTAKTMKTIANTHPKRKPYNK